MRWFLAFAILAAGAMSVAPQATPATDAPTWGQTVEVLVPLVSRWEGTGPTVACDQSAEGICARAYLDTIAEPDIWTVCYGDTNNVIPNELRTIEDCRVQLGQNLRRYRDGLHGYFSEETRAYRLTPWRDAAYTSLAYNVGIAGAGRSTATRRLNTGDVVGGCNAIGWWNRAGGRVIRGLVNRRADEVRLCLRVA